MKQSSIEWLAIQIMDNWNDITAGARDIAEFIDKSKAMHKEEHRKTFNQGLMSNFQNFEDYYNETFNTEEK